MQEFTYISAFAAGLLGGVHCIGMCGGIVGVLSFGAEQQKNSLHFFSMLLAYNLARISSYVIAGAVLAGIAGLAIYWLDIRLLQTILRWVAVIIMIALGMYLAGWSSILVHIEKAGRGLWQQLEPLARKFLPVRSLPQAFVLGLIWGWLPCGLVYSVLLWSVASANATTGALLMLCFGLGTLPNLLAMGVFAQRMSAVVRTPQLRRVAGVMVIGFGLWNVYLMF